MEAGMMIDFYLLAVIGRVNELDRVIAKLTERIEKLEADKTPKKKGKNEPK
jgi:uncharacterized small protein (DUF1192 family)